MLVLLSSLLCGVLTFGIFDYFFGTIESILPGVVIFGVSFWYLGKRISKQVEAAMLGAQKQLQNNRIDQGIAVLNQVKVKYKYWQFFLSSMIDGQIGTIFYMQSKFNRAKPYLEKSFARHWIAKVMLGVLYFRKRDFKAMDEAFETAAKYNAKQGLLWSTWAFCYYKAGKSGKAIHILLRGKKKLNGADKILEENLLALQNKKKMKMRGYGDQWYQFQLELSEQMKMARGGAVRFARG